MTIRVLLLTLCMGCLPAAIVTAQPDNAAIAAMVRRYKIDERGPYRDIRWFCKDGTTVPPRERCPQPGAVQRARYKEEVIALGKSNHIFLGQILSTTNNAAFWDSAHYNKRLKQYQLERYLRAVDDGWILRKGQYYRGAYQAEDEEAWGNQFLLWLLADDATVYRQFFLVRQAVRDIPRGTNDNLTQRIRANSQVIAEKYPPFASLRVKIHGQPDRSDLGSVEAFARQHRERLSAGVRKTTDQLIADLAAHYQPVSLTSLDTYLKQLPDTSGVRRAATAFIQQRAGTGETEDMLSSVAELLWMIRHQIYYYKAAKQRLAMLDLSLALEAIYFTEISKWQPQTLAGEMNKICHDALVLAGTGYLEEWEWRAVSSSLEVPDTEAILLGDLTHFLERSRSIVEWGTGMVRGVYQDVVTQFGGFESHAYGFYDDQIRSSVLLTLGRSVGKIGTVVAQSAGLTNTLLDVPDQGNIRGLNPGYARGELVVVSAEAPEPEVTNDKIYIFYHPPSDLKPVGGIATVTEGNLVSHVQLLARNLGIPNAVITDVQMAHLKKYQGQEVFYAVSPRGNVVMKRATEMTAAERALFQTQTRREERVKVPVEKIKLSQTAVLNMRDVDATASGILCGPKAANLGQLKKMFPDKVVEGLVIPFGIFRSHLDQPIPGQAGSYWDFLSAVFNEAQRMRSGGTTDAEVEAYTLGQLDILRTHIKSITLQPGFVQDLKMQFKAVFGDDLGRVPVFLRSDTNMEDLKEFTGAGLNLTLFNVLDEEGILQGIRDVWSSPFTERSFKWRQRYLSNPENVFPSILIIPSVNVESSGVLITKGITSGNTDDITIAFNRGVGGAVDGQAAETYLMTPGDYASLLSPARESNFRVLPETGGTETRTTTFHRRILSGRDLMALSALAKEIRKNLPGSPGIETTGPFDIELGILDGTIWLFQVRPFVENKNAARNAYLESIAPQIPSGKRIDLQTIIPS